eukprot:1970199-Rhodomonas_salina.2
MPPRNRVSSTHVDTHCDTQKNRIRDIEIANADELKAAAKGKRDAQMAYDKCDGAPSPPLAPPPPFCVALTSSSLCCLGLLFRCCASLLSLFLLPTSSAPHSSSLLTVCCAQRKRRSSGGRESCRARG